MKISSQAALAAMLLGEAPIAAQATPEPADVKAAKEFVEKVRSDAGNESVFEFSYASPGSPVLPLIGVAGDQITRSETLRKFGIAFVQGMSGQAGGQGVAIDFTPYWLFSPTTASLATYRDAASRPARLLARTKVGLAAGFGDKSAGRPSSLVASVSTSLLDSGDGLYSTVFDDCVQNSELPKAYKAIGQQVAQEFDNNPAMAGKLTERALEIRNNLDNRRQKAMAEAYTQCSTKLARAVAAKPTLDIGVGTRWRGTPGDFGQLTSSGTILWGTFATGVVGGGGERRERAGPLTRLRVRGVAHARFTFKDDVLDEKFVLQGRRNSSLLVAGIESAPSLDPKRKETLRWSLQAGWNQQSAVLPGELNRSYGRYQALVSLRLFEGLWANGTLSRVTGRGVKADTQALISFTFTEPGRATQIGEYYESRAQ